MFLHVIETRFTKDYRVYLKFNDGTEGEIDLGGELEEGIFKPLQDKEYFKSFKIIGHTLSWDNGADFAPEFLKEKLLAFDE